MKKYISLCLILSLVLSLCGCSRLQKKKTEEPAVLDSEIHLYIVNNKKVEPASESYQLKNPDSVSASVEEVLSALVLAFSGTLDFYTYMLDDRNNVILNINMGCDIDKEELVLVQAAISSTLFQLEAVENIQLTIFDLAGEELIKEELDRDSFYYYENEYVDLNIVTRMLYVSDDKKGHLIKKSVSVKRYPNKSDQELVVDKLCDMGYVPVGTKVNHVSTRGDICTVDFSSEFNAGVNGLSPELELYGVVNSVLEQTNAKKVQILIDGMVVDKYRNTVEISEPLSFNQDIVK